MATTGAEVGLTAETARRFVDALRAVEQEGDVERMAELADPGTHWASSGAARSYTGADGAREFWNAYRRSYADIASEFTAVTETFERAVLEWVGSGRHHNGTAVRYVGATVLDLGEDGSLDAVRLYFDTAAARAASTT